MAGKLGYYVYRLIDPWNGETFYVGIPSHSGHITSPHSSHQAQWSARRAASRWYSPVDSLASVHIVVPSQAGQVIRHQPPHSGQPSSAPNSSSSGGASWDAWVADSARGRLSKACSVVFPTTRGASVFMKNRRRETLFTRNHRKHESVGLPSPLDHQQLGALAAKRQIRAVAGIAAHPEPLQEPLLSKTHAHRKHSPVCRAPAVAGPSPGHRRTGTASSE